VGRTKGKMKKSQRNKIRTEERREDGAAERTVKEKSREKKKMVFGEE